MRRPEVKKPQKKDSSLGRPLEMVDVSDKPVVKRVAVAEGEIWLRSETVRMIRRGSVKKGDVLSAANTAGILAAKKTAELIPLCHLIPLVKVDISFSFQEQHITARCTVIGKSKTGVEIEALVGVSTALLTIWDMVKYLEKDREGQYPHTKITEVRILKKMKATTEQ